MAGKIQGKQGESRVVDFVVLQSPECERAVCDCPLLNRDWEAWFDCCTKRFLRLARIIAGDDARAAEALQESWIRVWRNIDSYRGPAPACAWVRAIVSNCAKDTWPQYGTAKCPASLPADAPEVPAPDPDEADRREQLYRLLDDMVGDLPRMYREVIALRYGEGLSTGKTADLLHISKSTVGTRLHRAVKKLRKSLDARIRGEASNPPAVEALP